MSLLTRWRRPVTDSNPTAPRVGSPLRVLRADGQRIDLSARDTGWRLSLLRQDWQTDAWDYRDMIGELRYSNRLLARSVARCRFYAVELRDHPDDPAELTGKDHGVDKQLAADAVAHLARLPLDDGPDGFLATLIENLLTAGEAWIHGEPDGSDERWTVRSVSEITSSADRVMLAELPGSSALGQRGIDPEREELLRCWIRHPRWGQLADSPLRAMLDTLEEIVLTGREIRAAARSRISANGLLLLPSSLSLVRVRSDDEELAGQSVTDDKFMVDFTAAVTQPIRAEGDAGAVVPLVLRGDPEALKEVRHIRLERADAAQLMERLNGAVWRMLRGLDVQPEQVEGVGATSSHWGGWLVEAASIRHQVEPWAAIGAGCLSRGFLRPGLEALDHDPDQVRRIAVWADTSDLAENPNRGQDARDAHTALVIKDATLRTALGFDDDDAPDDEELQRRVAARAGVDQATSAVVLDMARQLQQAHRTAPRVIDAEFTNALPAGETKREQSRPAAQPGQVIPERSTPAEPGGMVAAAQKIPADIPAEIIRELTALDATLVDRILIASDAAVARAVERAGGRARSAVRGAARKDPALAAAIDGVDAALVAAAVGRDRLTEFVAVPELLADGYPRLLNQVEGWLDGAAHNAVRLVVQSLGVKRESPIGMRVHDAVTDGMAGHRARAMAALTASLDATAERVLFQEGACVDLNRYTVINERDVARVVTIAGGGDPEVDTGSGVGTGPIVRDAITNHGGST